MQSEDEADVVILNTCAVRKKSEEKIYSHIGKLRKETQEDWYNGLRR